MTSPVQATHQADDEPGCQAFTTTTEPSSWMPLEGLAQTWAAFAGTFLTRPAYMATSMAFAALSLETQALMHERKMCFCRLKGDTSGARAAGAQTVQDLQVVRAQWERALYWLEQLATDEQGEPRSREEQAHIRRLFYETTEQLHRLNTLTFQVQEGCVVYYQQMGVVVEEEQEQECAGRQAAIGEGEEQE